MRLRASLERTGTSLLLTITVATLATVGVSSVFRSAADDLFATIAGIEGVTDEHAHTAYGAWLSARLAPEVARGDLAALQARANQLASQSDRLREATGIQGLIGLLVAILTGRPAVTRDSRREASQPAAKTASNGTA